jgi:hypothetical protein
MKEKLIDLTKAAIVCSHIAVDNSPILLAVKDEPVSEEDSGWQFLCDSGENENEDEAQVWSINEILEYEPSLCALLNHPAGTKLFRKNIKSAWIVSKN